MQKEKEEKEERNNRVYLSDEEVVILKDTLQTYPAGFGYKWDCSTLTHYDEDGDECNRDLSDTHRALRDKKIKLEHL